ncbi:MAG TPA: four helix bundle protein [Opitutaceae bacterium]|nr:four helix bundle protein [Opitutaceae bacterium]
MTESEMKQRTKTFALRILYLAQALPHTVEADVIKRQIVRSGTAVASAYRAVCRAKSGPDFAYKLSVVEEEADETALWLELIVEDGMLSAEKVVRLLTEANEITAMMVSSQKTNRALRAADNPKSKIQIPNSR